MSEYAGAWWHIHYSYLNAEAGRSGRWGWPSPEPLYKVKGLFYLLNQVRPDPADPRKRDKDRVYGMPMQVDLVSNSIGNLICFITRYDD